MTRASARNRSTSMEARVAALEASGSKTQLLLESNQLLLESILRLLEEKFASIEKRLDSIDSRQEGANLLEDHWLVPDQKGGGGGSCLPCTPEEEKQIVEELNREAERDLKWERYVGQGLVDNLDNGKSLESQDLDEPELVRMLQEGKDYVLVPKKVWEKLVQWYKGGPTLPRKMISQGVFNKMQFNVEVYPLRLKLIDSRDDSESTIQISKKASLQELYERVCSVRRVEREKASIWDYYNKQKSSQCALSCSSWEDFVKIFCRDFGSLGFEDYYERYSSLFSRDSFPVLSYTGTSQTSNGHRGARFVVREDSDFYYVLGVSKNSSKSEIKSAYRKLARSYHPVVNKEPDAEQKFKEISNAYEVLSDDEKRSIYDRYGEAGLKGAGMGHNEVPEELSCVLLAIIIWSCCRCYKFPILVNLVLKGWVMIGTGIQKAN